MFQKFRLFAIFIVLLSACSGLPEKPVSTVPIIYAEQTKNEELITIPASCPSERYIYVSWNLKDFGKTKTPEILEIMAKIAGQADIIAGQEINAGPSDGSGDGPEAVVRFRDVLKHRQGSWGYAVSNSTVPANPETERYAYWVKYPVSLVSERLTDEVEGPVSREPYSATFRIGSRTVQTFSIHTVPTAKNPIREIEALSVSGIFEGNGNMIFSGDLNLASNETDPWLSPLGFTSHIQGKTSLKMKVKAGEYLTKQYDNIYTKGDMEICGSGVIDFPGRLFSPVTNANLKAARKISDHLPVYIIFSFR